MYLTILRLVLPYAQKIAAQQITDFLNRRRELARETEELVEELREGTADCPPCPPCPPCPSPSSVTSAVAPYNFFSTTNTIFFALSGVLLGTTLAAIFYVFWKDLSSQE